ncbi:formate dehydrogenase accessory sulfurtransferase FdhD [Gudongella sp. DL1XJH-153]|uniref:formate dehydrogenase accessory sulfurtransferase FdhD n=1 Tax=Gudongella sp. DL1XJH-153 TaxID=3409804 RepID=UPI003BB6B646
MLDMINSIELSEEFPVTINLNGSKLITLMCTPSDLRELAIGHLINTGVVKSFSDIMTVAACEDLRQIYVIAENVSDKRFSLKDVFGTGCGSICDIPEEFSELAVNISDVLVSFKRIRDAFSIMYQDSERYRRHGGIHASAIIYDKQVVTMEDVARHNTHDKVIGFATYKGWDIGKTTIITTGRISADMVFKSARAGVPVICSRSNPTSLAVELALKLGITLVGRAVSRNATVYTHKERVLM